ncbi:RNA polymerase sporulation sigma factor SigK [Acidaminobacterium chupaoyuni]
MKPWKIRFSRFRANYRMEAFTMVIPAALFLLVNSIYLMLRVSPPAGAFPQPLSAEEEREALLKNAAGDLEARNLLIEHNLRLVAHVIKKYYASRDDQDDLISIGTFGLIKAISSFDPSKGARLATYASRCIENEILMNFRAKRKQSCEVSLSEPIDSDKDGNVLSLVDVIASDDNMMEALELSESQQQLVHYVNTILDPREREIITLRYGLFEHAPLPQREVAKLCGISRSYVSRLETKALAKLREEFDKSER